MQKSRWSGLKPLQVFWRWKVWKCEKWVTATQLWAGIWEGLFLPLKGKEKEPLVAPVQGWMANGWRQATISLWSFALLEVQDDGEREGNDEGDDGRHDHEVDGRARRHLVPRNVAPRRLLQRLARELVLQVVDLRQNDSMVKRIRVAEVLLFCVLQLY